MVVDQIVHRYFLETVVFLSEKLVFGDSFMEMLLQVTIALLQRLLQPLQRFRHQLIKNELLTIGLPLFILPLDIQLPNSFQMSLQQLLINLPFLLIPNHGFPLPRTHLSIRVFYASKSRPL